VGTEKDQPGKRACLNAEQEKHPDSVVLRDHGCKPGTVRSAGRTTTLDAVCENTNNGSRDVHLVLTFDSPKHVSVDVRRTLDPEAAYPAIENYDMHWVSADCGDIPPGTARYASKPLSAN